MVNGIPLSGPAVMPGYLLASAMAEMGVGNCQAKSGGKPNELQAVSTLNS